MDKFINIDIIKQPWNWLVVIIALVFLLAILYFIHPKDNS